MTGRLAWFFCCSKHPEIWFSVENQDRDHQICSALPVKDEVLEVIQMVKGDKDAVATVLFPCPLTLNWMMISPLFQVRFLLLMADWSLEIWRNGAPPTQPCLKGFVVLFRWRNGLKELPGNKDMPIPLSFGSPWILVFALRPREKAGG
jgi:hypothetical protein